MKTTLGILAAAVVLAGCIAAADAAVVGYWRFEEPGKSDGDVASGAGSILDSSGNAHHGTPSGGPIYSSDVPNPGAGSTMSLDFDGSNDYVDVGNHSDFDLTHQVTVETFFKPTGVHTSGVTYRSLVTKGGYHNEESSYQLYYEERGGSAPRARAALRLDNDVRLNLAGSANSLQLDEWYHAALVVDIDGSSGGTADLYVTGITTGFYEHNTINIAANRTMKSTTATVRIADSSTNRPRTFTGLIDEARISNAAVSPNQFLIVPKVRANYQDDFQGGSFPTDWAYQWNPTGIDITDTDSFVDLQWRSSGNQWVEDASQFPSPNFDAGYLKLRAADGHPGRGPGHGAASDGLDHYAIAAFTSPIDSQYYLTDSFLNVGSGSSNGVEVLVFREWDSANPIFSTIIGAGGGSGSFDTWLGTLAAGETIYVAVGPNNHAGSDGFNQFDFTLVAVVPEPGSLAVWGLLGLGCFWGWRRRRK